MTGFTGARVDKGTGFVDDVEVVVVVVVVVDGGVEDGVFVEVGKGRAVGRLNVAAETVFGGRVVESSLQPKMLYFPSNS